MNNFKGYRKVFFKIGVLLIGLVLGFGYLTLSYYQMSLRTYQQSESLFLNTKEKTTEAIINYQQFLELTESRLFYSDYKPEIILSILSQRIEALIGKNFPEVVSLRFLPTSNPSIAYTRLGTKLLDSISPHQIQDVGITYLGKGIFKIGQPLYNKHRQPSGLLESIFSIADLLYKDFTESEINVFLEEEKTLNDDQLSFHISGFPYVFALNRGLPSFWQFLTELRLQIIVAFIFGILLLALGIFEGVFLSKGLIIKLRTQAKKLQQNFQTLADEKAALSSHHLATKNLLKLKNNDEHAKGLFFNDLQARYRQMAYRAQAINYAVSEVILEEYSDDKRMKDVSNALQECEEVLTKLSTHYLVKERNETIDIRTSIKKIKQMFSYEIAENNINIEIQGKVKTPLVTDTLTFEVVLYNIFRIIMNRLSKNNYYKIVFEGNKSFEIIFYDNGYALEDRIYLVKESSIPENILSLGKANLKKFACYLGWELVFQSKGKEQNSIKLTIPYLAEESLPPNVVKLFDSKPYA